MWGFGSHFEPVEVIWGNFGVIFGPFRDHSGPFLTLNSNLLQTSHVITQNDRKWSRMQMMMVSRLNFKMFRSFWGLEWHQMTPKLPKNCRKVPEMASMSSKLLLKPSPSEFCSSCGRFEWSHD